MHPNLISLLQLLGSQKNGTAPKAPNKKTPKGMQPNLPRKSIIQRPSVSTGSF